ncbi:putative integrase [Stygiolobus sp. CP850M]|uniref:putative integrase n=1 Tax=Stygiolobus sp. CP850M TaxID=3133134 RepID=UPI003FD52D14
MRIREVKGKYYVYLIENGDGGQRRDHYIGSLEQIVKEYYDMKCRGRDLNPGHRLERLDNVSEER